MSSEYCTRSNIEDRMGTTNISAWADVDNDESAATIAARIARAIAVASDKIDDTMRTSHYLIPLTTPAGATPTAIVDIAAVFAGVWLRTARGVEDFEPQTGKAIHELTPLQLEAERDLENIRTGKTRINAL